VPGVTIDFPQDPGQAGKSQKWRFAELLMGFKFRSTPETGSKEQRAEPLAAQVGAERVHLVRGDWNSAFIEEMRNFPGGSLKDQVDAASRAFAGLVGGVEVPENAGPELMEATGTPTAVQVNVDDPW
jgi:predicted phage terminase large subunit-like protein